MAKDISQTVGFEVENGVRALAILEAAVNRYGATIDRVTKIEGISRAASGRADQLFVTVQKNAFEQRVIELRKWGNTWREFNAQVASDTTSIIAEGNAEAVANDAR